MSELILVAGATGALGKVIVRRLLGDGKRIRAISRDSGKLAEIAKLGAETMVADMTDRAAMDRACAGVTEVISTANNILGKGPTSPNRVDEAMYRTLGSAARDAGVRRWIHVSARDMSVDNPVDFFRVKARIDDILRNSGVPWVLLRPSAFMDVWTGVHFANPEKPVPVATVFGRGDRICNYIAMDDVTSFIQVILRDPGVVNESIDVGGPSELTQVQFATVIQQAMQVQDKRKHVPAPILNIARVAAKPFNEVAARFAGMGYWSTLLDRPFPKWSESANRFGIKPMTVEQFAQRFSGTPHHGLAT